MTRRRVVVLTVIVAGGLAAVLGTAWLSSSKPNTRPVAGSVSNEVLGGATMPAPTDTLEPTTNKVSIRKVNRDNDDDLEGWEMRVFAGENCLGTPIASGLTEEGADVPAAEYSLLLAPGTYSAAETLQPGWERMSPSCRDFTVVDGADASLITFANRVVRNGDGTGDGETNSVDASVVLQFTAGLASEDNILDFFRLDVNLDATTDSRDATLILQLDADLIGSLPVGASFTSDDGKLRLDLPAGALDEQVEITITAVSVDDLPAELREAGGPGTAYRLEPAGLVFNEPVPLTLELDSSELEDAPEDGVVAYLLLTQGADGEIETLDELVTRATLGEETVTISGKLSHFSFIRKSDGALEVNLDQVRSRQLVDVPFRAQVLFRNVSFVAGFTFDIEPVFVNHFGVPAVNTVGDVTEPGTVTVGGLRAEIDAEYVCSRPGAGKYGIDTTWRAARSTPNSELFRSFSVTIRGNVACVTTLATPTPTPTPTPGAATDTPTPTATPMAVPPTNTPTATSTPVPAEPTNTPTSTSTPVSAPPTDTPMPTTTTHSDATGDEVVVGGGSDAAVDITTVTIGPSSSGTKVFVTLPNASQSITHFSFAVRITLAGQVGLVERDAGSDNSVAPDGGSFAVGVEGVSMVFAKPVPSGAKLLVETFHLETMTSNFGSDTFTVTVP